MGGGNYRINLNLSFLIIYIIILLHRRKFCDGHIMLVFSVFMSLKRVKKECKNPICHEKFALQHMFLFPDFFSSSECKKKLYEKLCEGNLCQLVIKICQYVFQAFLPLFLQGTLVRISPTLRGVPR